MKFWIWVLVFSWMWGVGMALKKWIKVPLFVALFPDYIAYFKKWEKFSLFFFIITDVGYTWQTHFGGPNWSGPSYHMPTWFYENASWPSLPPLICVRLDVAPGPHGPTLDQHTRGGQSMGFHWARWSQLTISIGSTFSIACGDFFIYIFKFFAK